MLYIMVLSERSLRMSWQEKMKEFGGGDLAFLSEDGEVLNFIVVGEPVLLEGRYKGKPSEKIGCPIVTEDGFVLFIAGKRLARKISKHEGIFDQAVFQAIRHGEQNDITSTYDLKVLVNQELKSQLFGIASGKDFTVEIAEAIKAAESVMKG